jgi:hypothetical protein
MEGDTRCRTFRTCTAPHQTHQAVKIEIAFQPTPFLTHVLQPAKQKAVSTERVFDQSERTLTGMKTPRIDLPRRIRRHFLCMSVARIFVRFAAERALCGLQRTINPQ